jgi:hypothetical protein
MLLPKSAMASSCILEFQHLDGVKADICAHLHRNNPKSSTSKNNSKSQHFVLDDYITAILLTNIP